MARTAHGDMTAAKSHVLFSVVIWTLKIIGHHLHSFSINMIKWGFCALLLNFTYKPTIYCNPSQVMITGVSHSQTLLIELLCEDEN